jgi:excisionase family DNA binding protein
MKATDLVGIGEAAELLGMSRTSMQKLVDAGHVAALKTAGGHRRILRQSLQALLDKMGSGSVVPGDAQRSSGFGELTHEPARGISLLIVEDDEVVLAAIQRVVQKNCPDIHCTVARDGLEAVLQIERTRPNIVITDLSMEPFDGFRLLSLLGSKPEYRSIAALAVTAMSDAEIAEHGGLPKGVLLYKKPLQLERLLGFLEAQTQLRRRFGAT